MLFHHGALGDWVLTFPILRRLGKTLAVTSLSKARLASRLFPEVEPFDIERREVSSLYRTGCDDKCEEVWGSYLESAKQIISFVGTSCDLWASNVRRFAPQARVAFVDPLPPRNWRRHVCDWHDFQLCQQGVELFPETRLPSRASDGSILIHPGSGGHEKCWAIDRFEKLIQALHEEGYCIRVLLGEVEVESWPRSRVDRWIRFYRAEVVERLDSLQLIFSEARTFVGNDSGPTHLAAAMGLRTIALFGPTSPQRWAPRGPTVTLLAPPIPVDMSWLDVGVVLAACRW